MSELCHNSSDPPTCCSCPSPDYPFSVSLASLAGVLCVSQCACTLLTELSRCILVATVGAAGNLLTLLAIPWAQANKILGFHRTPLKYTTIFIVNLAFADFLYCVTSLPMYSTTYLHRGWPSGEHSWTCRGFAAFRYMTAYSAWMALGFVAFSRSVVSGTGQGSSKYISISKLGPEVQISIMELLYLYDFL